MHLALTDFGRWSFSPASAPAPAALTPTPATIIPAVLAGCLLGGLGRPRGVGLRPIGRLVDVLGFLVFVGFQQVGGVEKGALLQTDVNECGLNPREDRLHAPEIYVADTPPVVRAVYQQFDEAVVLENGHAGFPRAAVDKNLAFQAELLRPVGLRDGPDLWGGTRGHRSAMW
jgi:hypothetical protein